MPNAKDTQEGVRDAFGFWLEQHPVTMWELLSDAIEKQFDSWLDCHTDEIVEAIAQRSADSAKLIPSQAFKLAFETLRRRHADSPKELWAINLVALELKMSGCPIDTEA